MSKKAKSYLGTGILTFISIWWVMPVLIVLFNSFKNKVWISQEPFALPNVDTFIGLENYQEAITSYELLKAVGWTVFITVGSVLVILICTSMCAWFITRVTNRITKSIYILCVFSMVVPFQMVMFTLSKIANILGLVTPWGIIIIYLGFGAGLAVFMFCGFVKSIPIEIEEAAMIDGCTPLQTFFKIVLPIMKPTYISVGILETMWNDNINARMLRSDTTYEHIDRRGKAPHNSQVEFSIMAQKAVKALQVPDASQPYKPIRSTAE